MFTDEALKVVVVIFVYAHGSVFSHRRATALSGECAQRAVSVVPVITFYDRVRHTMTR